MSGTLPDAAGVPGLIQNAADIVVALNPDLVIDGIAINPSASTLGCLDHWAGRPFSNFLTEESREKFALRMAEFQKAGARAPISVELNHMDNATWEFPIRYTMHGVQGGAVLMLGRDLQPIAELQRNLVNEQLARERDYQKLRATEAFFRIVLDMSDTAMVLVEPKQGRIRDLNSAAAGMLGSIAQTLNGSVLSQAFEGLRREELSDSLQAAAASDEGRGVPVICRRNGRTLTLYPKYFRAGGDLFLLCRLVADETAANEADAGSSLKELFANTTDAMVMTDAKGDIRDANEAFLMMADAPLLRNVREQPFSDFLARGTIDLKLILEAADQVNRLRSYNTQIISPVGTRTSVDISATRFRQHGGAIGYGFIIRDITRREPMDPDGGSVVISEDSMKHMMDLVGTASLKDLVSATSDVVEKMCIETALQLTSNNRVATADMLGLSRQSLYVKLRKHGFIEESDDS